MKDPIVQEGAPILRKIAKAVPKTSVGDVKIRRVIKKMKDRLAKERYGVAIAAPQVGESLRIFVVSKKVFAKQNNDDATKAPGASPKVSSKKSSDLLPPAGQTFSQNLSAPQDKTEDMVFINPELIRLSRKKHDMSEGCLSVRGKYGLVERHEKATVKALGEDGKPFTYHGAGIIAHVFQHEVDHLNGILYIDKAKSLRDEREEEEAPEPAHTT